MLLAALALLGLGARILIGNSTRARLEEALEEFEQTYGHRVPGDLSPAPVPADENVAPLILALVEEQGDATQRQIADRVRRFSDLAPDQWTVEQRQTVEDFVATCGSWERFGALAMREQSDFELDYSLGWGTPQPPFMEILGIVRCVLISGRLALAEGDLGRFLVANKALANVANSQYTEPTLISQLIGMAADRHRWHLLKQGLGSGSLARATLGELFEIEDRAGVRVGLARGLETEALRVASTPSWVILRAIEEEGMFYMPTLERAKFSLMEPYGDLIRAAALDNRSRAIASLDRSLVETLRAIDAGTFYDPGNLSRDPLAPGIEGMLLKAYAADTAAVLARAALAAARDRDIDSAVPARPKLWDPMTGEPIQWTEVDGDLTVSAPAAEALWRQRSKFSGSLPPIFEWRIRSAAAAAEQPLENSLAVDRPGDLDATQEDAGR